MTDAEAAGGSVLRDVIMFSKNFAESKIKTKQNKNQVKTES